MNTPAGPSPGRYGCGLELACKVSAWVGGDGFDAVVAANHKLATDCGNAVFTLGDAQYLRWIKAASEVDDPWVKEVTATGANGPALLEETRALTRQYDR